MSYDKESERVESEISKEKDERKRFFDGWASRYSESQATSTETGFLRIYA